MRTYFQAFSIQYTRSYMHTFSIYYVYMGVFVCVLKCAQSELINISHSIPFDRLSLAHTLSSTPSTNSHRCNIFAIFNPVDYRNHVCCIRINLCHTIYPFPYGVRSCVLYNERPRIIIQTILLFSIEMATHTMHCEQCKEGGARAEVKSKQAVKFNACIWLKLK